MLNFHKIKIKLSLIRNKKKIKDVAEFVHINGFSVMGLRDFSELYSLNNQMLPSNHTGFYNNKCGLGIFLSMNSSAFFCSVALRNVMALRQYRWDIFDSKNIDALINDVRRTLEEAVVEHGASPDKLKVYESLHTIH